MRRAASPKPSLYPKALMLRETRKGFVSKHEGASHSFPAPKTLPAFAVGMNFTPKTKVARGAWGHDAEAK